MDVLISGYGEKPYATIKRYSIKEDGDILCQWQDSLLNPSFLCQGDGYLFTVTETEGFAVVYCYKKTINNYQLSDQRKIEGGALCHIIYSSRNKVLYGACYETGTIFGIKVEDGSFSELLHQEVQKLKEAEDNSLTRAHCVLLDCEERRLYTVNIALDCILLYTIQQGRLIRERVIKAPKGCGARHALLSEGEDLLYVITEYSNEILVYENQGEYHLLQRISTLNKGFMNSSNCSTLCFSKNRAYLYGANRGANTIAQFTVKPDGLLEWTAEYDCGGKHPRHMLISKDGEKLIVCNQNSNEVVCYRLDIQTGEVGEKLAIWEHAAPSGILELCE